MSGMSPGCIVPYESLRGLGIFHRTHMYICVCICPRALALTVGGEPHAGPTTVSTVPMLCCPPGNFTSLVDVTVAGCADGHAYSEKTLMKTLSPPSHLHCCTIQSAGDHDGGDHDGETHDQEREQSRAPALKCPCGTARSDSNAIRSLTSSPQGGRRQCMLSTEVHTTTSTSASLPRC